MATNVIKIKRSTGNSAPSSLNAGELAFTGGAGSQGNNGQRIFIGDPANSNAVTVIGGITLQISWITFMGLLPQVQH